MILHIKGPSDSISTAILVHDIARLETCVLKFFGKKLFNLYVIVKAEAGENFHLFSYANITDFQTAHSSITKILKEEADQNTTIQIEPYTQIGSISSKAVF